MKKYFYVNKGQKLGPLTYDELWNQKISPETMVWSEGMPDWQQANTIHEFANWFPEQPIAQKKHQQPIQKPQQPARPIQRKPVKRKKSYRGVIGIVIFLVGVIAIYYFWSQNNAASESESGQEQAIEQKNSQKPSDSKKPEIDIQIPAFASTDDFTKETFPLHPQQIGNSISDFLGSARNSFSDAKLLYMHPDAEEKFQYFVDTYSELALKVFFQGPIPVIKYQSLTSALILFYNPWNDLVLITEWQLVEGHLFIHDLELVTADLLAFDGLNIPEVDPHWARNPKALPIEALTNSMEERAELFDKLWGTQTGSGNWRKVLTSLLSPAILINDEAIVALRLRNHYAGMQYLMKAESLAVLRKPFVRDMKNLHSKDKLADLLNEGPQTPDIVRENFSKYPAEIWKYASLQVVRKVPEGAFVFVTTPNLSKTFLSFYYKFDTNNELILNRIDWCTFDNEL